MFTFNDPETSLLRSYIHFTGRYPTKFDFMIEVNYLVQNSYEHPESSVLESPLQDRITKNLSFHLFGEEAMSCQWDELSELHKRRFIQFIGLYYHVSMADIYHDFFDIVIYVMDIMRDLEMIEEY